MRPVAADALIVNDGKVVLVKRKKEPFEGKWALPGGFVDSGESVEDACVREAKEETGLEVRIKEMVGVFSKPGRDPRGTVGVAFLCKVISGEIRGGDDAAEARWFSLGQLPEVAFDHKEVISAVKRK
ncbi:NUDIX domain-containing protein [Candidatus Micrarchaeota archaeon]|nr:NUDIX domain-containing protein [Candidatus Micrarchaeota archaeon]MBD3418462.1 NUDIX domain-containing protein [Candidatus Micrarchaeota archaeon]